MRVLTLLLGALVFLALPLSAQDGPLQAVLQTHEADVAKASRKTIEPVLADIVATGLPEVQVFLERWREKEVWQRKDDKLFFYAREQADKTFDLLDLSTQEVVASATKSELRQLKPNSGVRGVIAAALVQFQLSDPDITRRSDGLDAIERDPEPSHLPALRASLAGEPDEAMAKRKARLERLLTLRFDEDEAARVAAITSFEGDLGVDARAALNPLLNTTRKVATTLPEGINLAGRLTPGEDGFSEQDAYALLVSAGLAPAPVSDAEKKSTLIAAIEDDMVAGMPVASLDTQSARDQAYARLVANGQAPPDANEQARSAALASHVFYDQYTEPSAPVTDAAQTVLAGINTKVGLHQTIDLGLDALSLASIYFLAAIGLAITFGVMGVINMAHGEFIMMGAYTGYVVQLFVPDYTLSILIALPLAFAITFGAGVAMERLVIRWLYNRPLETLLATFGISIALQQIAKNIFGTQARPLTSPEWLDGALIINDVIGISYIRIAIFVLGLVFLVLLLFILNRTRLGLEVRAVTQNPAMAASMGINPDKINMLTFGLGSGIAGIAGVAIGLFAKVTSELGSDYIVQSFMTVVVGGVGNIWGTLAGATLIGFLQKGIEWLNPSNTLAAQTFMIVFIIIFIQFRPRGIIALKGRAAGD
ncbi:MAG: urea ABC transporter permease subunit UrtB [Pseudomonadota bacterium]